MASQRYYEELNLILQSLNFKILQFYLFFFHTLICLIIRQIPYQSSETKEKFHTLELQ